MAASSSSLALILNWLSTCTAISSIERESNPRSASYEAESEIAPASIPVTWLIVFLIASRISWISIIILFSNGLRLNTWDQNEPRPVPGPYSLHLAANSLIYQFAEDTTLQSQ